MKWHQASCHPPKTTFMKVVYSTIFLIHGRIDATVRTNERLALVCTYSKQVRAVYVLKKVRLCSTFDVQGQASSQIRKIAESSR
jgi:hypothetical protein